MGIILPENYSVIVNGHFYFVRFGGLDLEIITKFSLIFALSMFLFFTIENQTRHLRNSTVRVKKKFFSIVLDLEILIVHWCSWNAFRQFED